MTPIDIALEKAFGKPVVPGQAPQTAQPAQPAQPAQGAADAPAGAPVAPVAVENDETKYANSQQYYQTQREKIKSENTEAKEGGSNPASATSQNSANADPLNNYETTFLSERLGGKFKTVDELTQALSTLEQLAQENKTLAEKKDYIKPANDFIKKLNQATERNIPMESFLRIEKFTKPVKDLTPQESIERIAIANEVEYGESPSDAILMAQRKYKLALLEKDANGDYPNGEDPDDVREAQISLRRDTVKADALLDEYKVKTLEPLNQTPETVEQKTQATQAAWAPEIPKIQEKFGKMSFTTQLPPDKGQTAGQEMTFDFPMPDKVAKEIPAFINRFLSYPGLDVSVGKDNELLEDAVRNFIIPQILPDLIKAAASSAKKEFLKNELNKGYNSSAREESPSGGGTGKKDNDRIIANAMSYGKVPLNK